MMNLDQSGFRRARSFVLEHAITVQTVSADLRWALAAVALQSLGAAWAFARARLAALIRGAARRIRRKVRIMALLAAADTMVAAGGR